MGWDDDNVAITELIGKMLVQVENLDDTKIVFAASDGSQFEMYHSQDCCESVSVESITGDLSDLLGEPILRAEEVSSEIDPEGFVPSEYRDSYTWTFYKLATRKGYVDIRWYGESNGYYSESVDFIRTREPHAS